MNFDNITPPEGGKRKYNPSDYVAFGDKADYAFQQGWQPSMQGDGGAIIYKNNYSPAFNGVLIGNKPIGRMELVGNKNGLFDVRIVNSENGKIVQPIMKGQPFNVVDDYFRNSESVIQQRMNRVQGNPETQQYNGLAWNQ